LTEPHPPLFHKHFGMEHLKFKSVFVAHCGCILLIL